MTWVLTINIRCLLVEFLEMLGFLIIQGLGHCAWVIWIFCWGCGCCCSCFWWSPFQSSSWCLQKGHLGPHLQFSTLDWWLVVLQVWVPPLWGVWASGIGCAFSVVIYIIGREWPVFSCLKKVSQYFPCFGPWGICMDWSIFE